MRAGIAPPPVPAPGYRLLRRIGMDPVGVWFEAEQESLGRRVSVKVLRPELRGDGHARQAFLAEIDRLSPLAHPNLLCVLDATRGAEPALVSEPLAGPTLADALDAEPRFDEARALEYARDLARALAYLAGEGLAHRNLSPALVHVSAEGRCRLVTFGQVVPLADLAALRGRLAQDPRYVAPEQVAGTDAVGPRAATYQVGSLLFHMLGGQPPHAATDPVAAARAHVERPFPAIRRVRPSAVALEPLLAAATGWDPAGRPDPGELADEIDGILAGRRRRSVRAPRRRRTRRRG
jgi:serine/threonine-protein kinase